MLNRVLLVDDSWLIHRLFHLMLQKYGCAIASAANGTEGLEKLAADKEIDLVFLDLDTPEIDAAGFLKKIKREGRLSRTPVIVVGGRGREDEVRKARLLGAVGRLVKPFRSSHLHAAIEKAMTKKAPVPNGAEKLSGSWRSFEADRSSARP